LAIACQAIVMAGFSLKKRGSAPEL